ncbi:short-chain dehydrogenase [Diaporthe amygdali]|uniref:short-chain dehydrogenase n=1 Tax=Phomopsis amygdali TaxID=1214568 RepID=UPI0022FECCA4|nr:short-chain dehydrogenase [Diaporthe amygdali]KAJ0124800.1 short-chain dehydrogenase [Diaporthe amygdali]
MSNLNFKCALITGGGGGIGRAMAEYFISKGKKVIICGRTEANLKITLKEINCAGYYVVDTGDTAKLPDFIEKITKEHPDLDCLVNNAGVQRPLQVLKDDPADLLSKADNEIDVNIRGPMHLAVGLLEHFKSKPAASIINVSSVLGFVPFSILNPVYNGTKAWVHFWTMSLRVQLKDTNIKIIEIAPPQVGTDLHREREDPDDNKKHKSPTALTVEEFMEEVAQKLERGDETFAAGMGQKMVDKWYDSFGETFDQAAKNWK